MKKINCPTRIGRHHHIGVPHHNAADVAWVDVGESHGSLHPLNRTRVSTGMEYLRAVTQAQRGVPQVEATRL